MLMAKRPHLSLLDHGPKERARLHSRLEKNGLGTVCIAGYNNFTADLEHGDIPHREIQIHYVTELARLAHDLGGNLVRIFTGYETAAASYSAQWQVVIDALRECARRAAEFGVTIGVQNHHDLAVSSEALRELIRTVGEPNCQAMFDAWAPALHGDDLNASARMMGSLSVHTTLANYCRLRRFHYDPAIINYQPQVPALQAVPIDEGFIDYGAFSAPSARAGSRGASPMRSARLRETAGRFRLLTATPGDSSNSTSKRARTSPRNSSQLLHEAPSALPRKTGGQRIHCGRQRGLEHLTIDDCQRLSYSCH